MRKYDAKNKRNIGIIIVISVILIIIFSFFLYKTISKEKTKYIVASSSFLLDNDKNEIITKEESTLRKKWGSKYYLTYQEKQYSLGDNAIVYNQNSGEVSLYGKFYEVSSDATVDILQEENIINSQNETKFYKIDDRKYLLISDIIKSEDSYFSTTNYLIVELDRKGNATLRNNKVNFKTFSETTIITSIYTFDIANEILKYDEMEIDLKKIIGSTNEYSPEDLRPDNSETTNPENNNPNNNGNGGNSGTTVNPGNNDNGGNNGSGTNNGNGASGGNSNQTPPTGTQPPTTGGEGNNNQEQEDENIEDIITNSKNTSIVRIIPNINSITVDYVVYDPNDEYKNIYVEITNQTTNITSLTYLNKNLTNIDISNLSPNTKYTLAFKYTYLDENKEVQSYTFDTSTIITKSPNLSITLSNITTTNIDYRIDLDNQYEITTATITLLKNDEILTTKTIEKIGVTNEIKNNFDISSFDIKTGDIITVKLTELEFNATKFSTNVYYKFKY